MPKYAKTRTIDGKEAVSKSLDGKKYWQKPTLLTESGNGLVEMDDAVGAYDGAVNSAKFYGKTVKFNQKLPNGNFHDVSFWDTYQCSYSVNENVAKVVPVYNPSAPRCTVQSDYLDDGNVYYYTVSIKAETLDFYPRLMFYGDYLYPYSSKLPDTNWHTFEIIKRTIKDTGASYTQIGCQDTGAYTGGFFSVKDVSAVNLTDIFGTGNEPSSLDDERIVEIKNILEKRRQYDAGSLVSNDSVWYCNDSTVDNSLLVQTVPNTSTVVKGALQAETVRDEHDAQIGKWNHMVGVLDLGTLSYEKINLYANPIFYTNIPTMPLAGKVLCSLYTHSYEVSLNIPNKTMWNDNFAHSPKNLCFRDDDYATPEDFKSAMSGVLLLYELAEPYEETVTPQPITLQKGYNALRQIDGSLANTEAEVKYYGVGGAIPPEYNQVEYIQTDGVAYINTGVKTKDGFVIDITGYVTNDNSLFGSDSGQNTERFNITSQRSYRYSTDVTTGLSFETLRHIVMGNNELYVDEEKRYTFVVSLSTEYSAATLKLFARSDGTDVAGNGSRIYQCKCYQDDELLRDFVPVKRKADNVFGFYDKVSKQFFGSVYSGTFSGGNPV